MQVWKKFPRETWRFGITYQFIRIFFETWEDYKWVLNMWIHVCCISTITSFWQPSSLQMHHTYSDGTLTTFVFTCKRTSTFTHLRMHVHTSSMQHSHAHMCTQVWQAFHRPHVWLPWPPICQAAHGFGIRQLKQGRVLGVEGRVVLALIETNLFFLTTSECSLLCTTERRVYP